MGEIAIEGLYYGYDGAGFVIRGLDYNFQGERLAVCGPNGSGKSTLCKIIAGLLTPVKGTCKATCCEGVRPQASLVAPWAPAYPELTTRENLDFVHSLSSHRPKAVKPDDLIHELGLTDYAEKPAGSLSTGWHRRLQFAMALATGPDILVLDEPFSNLDAEGKELISSRIADYQSGSLVIIATNNVDEVESADSVIDLADYIEAAK